MKVDGFAPFTPFRLSVARDARESVVAPYGELDLASIGELTAEVQNAWEDGFRRVVVDLRSVDFIDSSGLRGLLGLRESAARDDHDLALRAGPPGVQRIFDVTDTTRLFHWR